MNKKLIIILVIFAAGFVLYAPNMGNKLFWDDADWILNNTTVHNLSWQNVKFIFSHDALAGIGLKSNYYRPLMFLTFMANYIINGANPFPYHLVNNLLHVANALLAFTLLFLVFKKLRPAFLAALLFLIHPLQTEAVAYVAGRGDPMSVFFMLTALLLFIKSRDKGGLNIYYLSSIAAAVLAILSRETAFLFPVYLVVFLMAFVHKDRFWLSFKKSVVNALPFFGLSLFYGILRLTVLNFQNTLNFYERSNAYTEHLSYRIYTFFHVIAIYLKLIFVPLGLHMERDTVVNTSLFQWPVWLGVLIVAVIIGIGVLLYKKEKITKSNLPVTHFRLWLFGWGFFFINLAPTSGVFPINALIYEHWLYFSLFGFFAIVAFYLDVIFDFLKSKAKPLFYAAVVLFLAYVSFFSFQTVQRNIIWGKTDKFYEDVLFYEPDNVRVLNNLANYYSDHGRNNEAEALYWRAVKVDDVQPAPYYNLANLLRDRGDYAGAIELYKKTISVNPSFPFAYTNLAAIYATQGNLADALYYIKKLMAVEPNNYTVYYNIGVIDSALGRKDEALRSFQIGLRLIQGNTELENKFREAIKSLK